MTAYDKGTLPNSRRAAMRLQPDEPLEPQFDAFNAMLERNKCPARLHAIRFDLGNQIGLCVEWFE